MAPTLYPALLGDAEWALVPEAVRRIHEPGVIRGFLRVRHGESGIARLLARALRFPPESERVEVELRVAELDGRRAPRPLEWRRRVGATILGTVQEATAGRVRERYGMFACDIVPRVVAGGLDHVAAGGFVGWGRRWWRLPSWLAPRASAETRVRGDAAWINVCLAAPWVGTVLCYEGEVRREADS